MSIAEVWAEFHSTKKTAAALTLHYSIINTANRNQWKEWVHLNYDHLTRILAISEKTIKSYLDLLSDPDYGILDKEYDFRNKGKIAVRLRPKNELTWVNIHSPKDYEFTVDPPTKFTNENKSPVEDNPITPPVKVKKTKEPKQRKKQSDNPKPVITDSVNEDNPSIDFTYGENLSEEFYFSNMAEFANKNYNSFPDEVKNTITEKEFNGYVSFYKKFAIKYFNNQKYLQNVKPFEYVTHLFQLNDEQIQKAIDKVLGSGGFYANGSIAMRIKNASTWSDSKLTSSQNDIIEFNGASYTMNTRSISMMKIDDRERVKRLMYNIIQGCTTVDTLTTALTAKKILEAYKINGESNIDSSTVDHSNKIITKLENLAVTKNFIHGKEEVIKEFLSKLIVDTKEGSAYFIYCYATHINKFHLQFSYNKIIEELYKIESIDSDSALAIKTKQVLERVVEKYMKDKQYNKNRIYEYQLDAIHKDEEFMSIWRLHVTSITPKTNNFKLQL